MTLKDKKQRINIGNLQTIDVYAPSDVKEAVLEFKSKFNTDDEEDRIVLKWIEEIFGNFKED